MDVSHGATGVRETGWGSWLLVVLTEMSQIRPAVPVWRLLPSERRRLGAEKHREEEREREGERELTLSPITLRMHQRSLFLFFMPYISFRARIFIEMFSLLFRSLKTLLFLRLGVTAAIFLSLSVCLCHFSLLFLVLYPSIRHSLVWRGGGHYGEGSKKSLYDHELWMSREQAIKTSVSAKILPHLIRFFRPIISHKPLRGLSIKSNRHAPIIYGTFSQSTWNHRLLESKE